MRASFHGWRLTKTGFSPPDGAETGGRKATGERLLLTVDGVRGERGQADGQVLRPVGARGAVLDPLPRPCDDGLARADIQNPVAGSHAKAPLQDDGVLVELRRLRRLGPSGRALHAGDAHP